MKLKLRWPDFSTITRQSSLTEPTQEADQIYKKAAKLLAENWDRKTPVRLIGVGTSGLTPPSRQLTLWDQVDYTKIAHLEAAIYEVRTKFGDQSIQKGFHSQTTNPDENFPSQ